MIKRPVGRPLGSKTRDDAPSRGGVNFTASQANVEKGVLNRMTMEGCTARELGRLFNVSDSTVSQRLSRLTPASYNLSNAPRWRIQDAAPLLIVVRIDNIEQVLSKMSEKDLPPRLQKEFWAAVTARERYREYNGELWRSGAVSEVIQEVFKAVRSEIQLIPDRVGRETEISEKQVQILIRMMDTLLVNIGNAVRAAMGKRSQILADIDERVEFPDGPNESEERDGNIVDLGVGAKKGFPSNNDADEEI